MERHRRSIRLAEFDYTHPGAYFVTLASWNHQSLFGEVVGEESCLNRFGLIAQGELQRLPLRFPSIQIDEYVIMPNHVHFILWILAETSASVGARRDSATESSQQSLASPISARGARLQDMGSNSKSDSASPLQEGLSQVESASPLHGPSVGALGTYIGAYKTSVARLINNLRHTRGTPVWQRNYYEHVIRNDDDLDQIRRYIQSNPLYWQKDQDNLP